MRERAGKLDLLASNLAVAGTEAMLKELVEVTPVDTSTALSNWQINLGTPAGSELPAHTVGSKGSTRGVSASRAIAEGIMELQAKKPGETIYLSNLTPYIKDLDEGSSRQFPGGFIDRALIAFRIGIEDAKKDLMR